MTVDELEYRDPKEYRDFFNSERLLLERHPEVESLRLTFSSFKEDTKEYISQFIENFGFIIKSLEFDDCSLPRLEKGMISAYSFKPYRV